jgi:hypothetical protein
MKAPFSPVVRHYITILSSFGRANYQGCSPLPWRACRAITLPAARSVTFSLVNSNFYQTDFNLTKAI